MRSPRSGSWWALPVAELRSRQLAVADSAARLLLGLVPAQLARPAVGVAASAPARAALARLGSPDCPTYSNPTTLTTATTQNLICVDKVEFMTQIRIKDAASLLGVSDDTVRRWIDQGELTATTDSSNLKVVSGNDLAELAKNQANPATDPLGIESSARNRFVGLVTKITSDKVMSQVELQCGPYRVVSLLSTEAVHELGLEVGSIGVAAIKATHVVIETD